MSFESVSEGLRRLADEIDKGHVDETVTELHYGIEIRPSTDARSYGQMKTDHNGRHVVTIFLKFRPGMDAMYMNVIGILTGRTIDTGKQIVKPKLEKKS